MTKTTSYEISKDLKEIGFEANPFFYRQEHNQDQVIIDATGAYDGAAIRCYDLETILDALPTEIEITKTTWITITSKYNFIMSHNTLYYEEILEYPGDNNDAYYYYREEGESLADTAARLLIKLIKDKVVEL